MGLKCPKGVQKGVPKWVPQRSEPRKSRKIFFLWPHYRGLSGGPPLKNTVLGSSPQYRIPDFQILPKSAAPPRMAQRGEKRTSSHLLAMGVRYRGELPEKLAKKGVPLFWALFGDFGDFR